MEKLSSTVNCFLLQLVGSDMVHLAIIIVEGVGQIKHVCICIAAYRHYCPLFSQKYIFFGSIDNNKL
jgi:hypothetical protein